jgi:hypothetical protein
VDSARWCGQRNQDTQPITATKQIAGKVLQFARKLVPSFEPLMLQAAA